MQTKHNNTHTCCCALSDAHDTECTTADDLALDEPACGCSNKHKRVRLLTDVW